MPVSTWLGASWGALAMVGVSTVAIYLALITYTRLAGLRSFSKMSSFDFATTVAFGSLMASVAVSPSATLAQGAVALAVLYGLQVSLGILRRRSRIAQVVDNQPRLLMAGSEVLHEHLRAARVTEDDLRAKLREANILHLDQVRAVVMESTGDISVLHAGPDGPTLDLDLLQDVVGVERLQR